MKNPANAVALLVVRADGVRPVAAKEPVLRAAVKPPDKAGLVVFTFGLLGAALAAFLAAMPEARRVDVLRL